METDPINIIDPRLIPQTDDPTIVFYNNIYSEIGWLIDTRTNIKGIPPTEHAMLSRTMGKFVVQDMKIFNAYNELPMDRYLIKGSSLAFVQLVNSNLDFIKAFNDSINSRLSSPWWITQYDYLGILGQAIGIPWIHTPGLRYCSVDVIRHLVNACPKLPKEDQLVINNIQPETNPELLRKITIDNPSVFKLKYLYNAPPGVIL